MTPKPFSNRQKYNSNLNLDRKTFNTSRQKLNLKRIESLGNDIFNPKNFSTNQTIMIHETSDTEEPICKQKTMKISDLTILKELGRGSFGQVMLVFHNLSKQYYALKCLYKDGIRGKKQIQHIQNEK